EEPYEEYEAEEVDELYEEYGKGENEPYQYEAVEKSVRHFQTFDLKSAEADKGQERESSGQKGMRINAESHTKLKAEGLEQEEMQQQPLSGNDAESECDGYCDEDDWIEDEDWQEPESDVKPSVKMSANTPSEDDWLDDDEGNAEDDWIEDDEWVE
ncbi:MAG: hypothetical protein K2N98_09510, partial [Lachnospiraceae bacterium]|nr:hypothetical protein [Lachnospiraceae bacterium]